MPVRVLIVEDDPMNAKLFDLLLTRAAKFDVEVTEDPVHVEARVRAGTVDVIIMDVSLSNSVWDGVRVDGLEICRRLRRQPETRGIPILLATAHAMKGSREKFLAESGADDYISKPIVSSAELIQKVMSLAQKRSHGATTAPR